MAMGKRLGDENIHIYELQINDIFYASKRRYSAQNNRITYQMVNRTKSFRMVVLTSLLRCVRCQTARRRYQYIYICSNCMLFVAFLETHECDRVSLVNLTTSTEMGWGLSRFIPQKYLWFMSGNSRNYIYSGFAHESNARNGILWSGVARSASRCHRMVVGADSDTCRHSPSHIKSPKFGQSLQ